MLLESLHFFKLLFLPCTNRYTEKTLFTNNKWDTIWKGKTLSPVYPHISLILYHWFLTHGYSIVVAVNYSWDFLICINFLFWILQPALLGWFIYKVSSIHNVYHLKETCSPCILPFKQSLLWFYGLFINACSFENSKLNWEK